MAKTKHYACLEKILALRDAIEELPAGEKRTECSELADDMHTMLAEFFGPALGGKTHCHANEEQAHWLTECHAFLQLVDERLSGLNPRALSYIIRNAIREATKPCDKQHDELFNAICNIAETLVDIHTSITGGEGFVTGSAAGNASVPGPVGAAVVCTDDTLSVDVAAEESDRRPIPVPGRVEVDFRGEEAQAVIFAIDAIMGNLEPDGRCPQADIIELSADEITALRRARRKIAATGGCQYDR